MDCGPPGSSLHGILQTRTLEWVAISSSRGSSQPRDGAQVSRIAGGCFTIWATRRGRPPSQAQRKGLLKAPPSSNLLPSLGPPSCLQTERFQKLRLASVLRGSVCLTGQCGVCDAQFRSVCSLSSYRCQTSGHPWALGPLCVGSPRPHQECRRARTGGHGGLCEWGAGRPGEEGASAEPTGAPSECREPPGLGVLAREAGSVSTAATMTGHWESSQGRRDSSGGIGAEEAEAAWLQELRAQSIAISRLQITFFSP